MSATGDSARSPSLAELLAEAGVVVGLAVAWLYTAGRAYAYGYFDRFGIPLLMVEIGREDYVLYGSVVLRWFWGWALAGGGALIVIVGLWRWIGLLFGRLALPLGIAAVAALFWLGHAAGVAAAHREYMDLREGDYAPFRRVQLWLKADAPLPAGAPAAADLAQGCHRLLLSTGERLFVVRPFRGAPAAELPVLIVPWEDIAALRILPDETSCR